MVISQGRNNESDNFQPTSSRFLNESVIPSIPPTGIETSQLTNNTSFVDIQLQKQIINVTSTITYHNTLGRSFDSFPINHIMISYTEKYTTPELRQYTYPLGFKDIHLQYWEVAVNHQNVNYTIHNSYLKLQRSLLQDERITITIGFSLHMVETTRRFGRFTTALQEEIYSFANLLPYMPTYKHEWRTDFYYSDDPAISDVALYDVTVDHPSEFRIAATGQLMNQVNITSSLTRSRYVTKPVRDWTLVGSSSYLLDTINTTLPSGRSAEVDVLYPPSQREYFAKGAEQGARILHYYSQEYGEYSYNKLILAFKEIGFNGMEYPQLILLSHPSSAEHLEQVLAHEIAHQWNPIMTGTDQNREFWLDEGLASYFTEEYRIHFHLISVTQEYKFMHTFTEQYGSSTSIINQTVATGDQNFGTFAYIKQSYVFNDIENTLGRDLWHFILKNYYHSYQYKIAYAIDLVASIATQLNQQWPYKHFDYLWNKPGIPTYHLTFSYTDDKDLKIYTITYLPTEDQTVHRITIGLVYTNGSESSYNFSSKGDHTITIRTKDLIRYLNPQAPSLRFSYIAAPKITPQFITPKSRLIVGSAPILLGIISLQVLILERRRYHGCIE